MTPAQCHTARALINMSEAKLSHVAVVPITAVRDFELAGAITRQSDIDALQAALERAGVEFIGDVGVKLLRGHKTGAP
jgi:acetyl-CoA acetyltransferase